MLLQRLADYAHRDGAELPFHRDRLFDWQLALDEHGRPETLTLISLAAPDAAGKLRGALHTVPTMTRTVGVAANLAADDAQYVLGWADEDSKPARVAQCHAEFADLTRRWATSETGRDDPVARAVWAFYRDGGAASIVRPQDCTAKSGVLITVAGVPAYRSPSVPGFWAEEVARSKGAATGRGLCLACGEVRPLLDTMPGRVPSRLVPGASNDTALVSVNERVFGYDLTTQLAASPICMTCGEAVTAGLARILASDSSTTYGGQNSRVAWWTTEETPFDPMTLLSKPSAEQVGALLQSVHRGRLGSIPDSAKFCSVSVGGNVARVMVRDWLEMPLAGVVENVARWFGDQETVPFRADGRRHHGLGRCTLVCGRWLRGRGEDQGRYADFGAKGADRPDGLHRDLVRAALRGTPLPPSLLAHLVHRVRSDGHLDDARAALIRLILTRHPLITEKPMPGLDHDNTIPAYIAGRTFAALEQIQYDVTGGKLNTTYGDRYFAGAISNPRAALVSGRRDAIAWLRKLRGNPAKKGAAVRHEKELDMLFGLIGPDSDFPSRTTIREQSLFLLGYHHQRADRFASIAAAKADPPSTTDSEDIPS